MAQIPSQWQAKLLQSKVQNVFPLLALTRKTITHQQRKDLPGHWSVDPNITTVPGQK